MDNKKLKDFWRKDGHDFIADIGNMEKAVVVARYFTGKYGISPRSYFPFSEAAYERRFDDYFDACAYSEEFIRNWVESIFYNPPKIQNPKEILESYKKITIKKLKR